MVYDGPCCGSPFLDDSYGQKLYNKSILYSLWSLLVRLLKIITGSSFVKSFIENRGNLRDGIHKEGKGMLESCVYPKPLRDGIVRLNQII